VKRFSSRGLGEEKTGRKRIDPRYTSLSARSFLALPDGAFSQAPQTHNTRPSFSLFPQIEPYDRRTTHSNFGGEK